MKTALLVVAMLTGVAVGPAAGQGRQASPAATPPAECLTLETFPVPTGERPHVVAEAANGTGIWYKAQGASAAETAPPRWNLIAVRGHNEWIRDPFVVPAI